jgi:hypothetical protein
VTWPGQSVAYAAGDKRMANYSGRAGFLPFSQLFALPHTLVHFCKGMLDALLRSVQPVRATPCFMFCPMHLSVLRGKSCTFVCGATRKQTQPPSCSSSSRLSLRRRCSGSVQWTHANCLKRWLESRPGGLPRTREGEVISSILSCEVCNGPYSIKIVQQPEWTAQRCLQKHQPLNPPS